MRAVSILLALVATIQIEVSLEDEAANSMSKIIQKSIMEGEL